VWGCGASHDSRLTGLPVVVVEEPRTWDVRERSMGGKKAENASVALWLCCSKDGLFILFDVSIAAVPEENGILLVRVHVWICGYQELECRN
jgi:hypothetical protein